MYNKIHFNLLFFPYKFYISYVVFCMYVFEHIKKLQSNTDLACTKETAHLVRRTDVYAKSTRKTKGYDRFVRHSEYAKPMCMLNQAYAKSVFDCIYNLFSFVRRFVLAYLNVFLYHNE